MTLETLLADADPARTLPSEMTDATAARAEAMLTSVLAAPRATERPARRRSRATSLRRVAIGGALAGAAATALLAAPMPWDGGTGSTSSAYAVTAGSDGSIKVVVDWNDLSDVTGLQAALDRAHAHVTVLIESGSQGPGACPAPTDTVGYRGDAVRWRSGNSGFVVWPDRFPPSATFVVAVGLGHGTSGSTFAPGRAQIADIASFMVLGPVPTCAP